MKAQLLLLVACAVGLTACATPHKVYTPPSNVKVVAATKAVKAVAVKATITAKEAQDFVNTSRVHADSLTARAGLIKSKVHALAELAPGPIGAIEADLTDLRADAASLTLALTQAQNRQVLLETQLTELNVKITQLEQNQATYYTDALKLAAIATEEREYRITAEKQLLSQRIWGWAWKIGGGVLLLGAITFVVLWLFGRITLGVAKVVG